MQRWTSTRVYRTSVWVYSIGLYWYHTRVYSIPCIRVLPSIAHGSSQDDIPDACPVEEPPESAKSALSYGTLCAVEVECGRRTRVYSHEYRRRSIYSFQKPQTYPTQNWSPSLIRTLSLSLSPRFMDWGMKHNSLSWLAICKQRTGFTSQNLRPDDLLVQIIWAHMYSIGPHTNYITPILE